MTTTFTLVTPCPVGPEAMFDVSLNIDVQAASMGRVRGRAVAGVTRGRIGLGETVTWRARLFGVWFTHTSRITALEAPQTFTDEMVSGPLRDYAHHHTFEPAPAGCLMIDRVRFTAPVFGVLAERWVLLPVLRRLIRRRNEALLSAVG